ncbi:MAG: STAS domain-containing protein [Thiotrichales bacterium]
MTDNNKNAISLPEKLDLATVDEFHKKILAATEKGQSVELDLCALKEIDTAGMQLLSAAVRESEPRSVKLTGDSARFAALASALGLNDHFKAHWEH